VGPDGRHSKVNEKEQQPIIDPISKPCGWGTVTVNISISQPLWKGDVYI